MAKLAPFDSWPGACKVFSSFRVSVGQLLVHNYIPLISWIQRCPFISSFSYNSIWNKSNESKSWEMIVYSPKQQVRIEDELRGDEIFVHNGHGACINHKLPWSFLGTKTPIKCFLVTKPPLNVFLGTWQPNTSNTNVQRHGCIFCSWVYSCCDNWIQWRLFLYFKRLCESKTWVRRIRRSYFNRKRLGRRNWNFSFKGFDVGNPKGMLMVVLPVQIARDLLLWMTSWFWVHILFPSHFCPFWV